MITKEESFSIIIAGNWNKYILNPGWIAKEVFEEAKIQVEFAINMGLPPRYTSTETAIRFIPADDRIILLALKPTEESLGKMESLAIKLLDKLPYTPITALGINFGFTEKTENTELLKLFNFVDTDKLSDFKCIINSSNLIRRMIVEDRVLNLRITHSGKDIDFDFNFNYDVTSPNEAKTKLTNKVVENKKIAETLLKSVYDLDYDVYEEVTSHD